MSDDYGYDDEFDNDQDNSPSGLRKAIKAANKAAKDAEARAAKAEKALAERTLSDTLSGRGYDTKVAAKISRFMSKDEVDVSDEDAVSSWLEDNGDIFPAPASQHDDDGDPDDQEAPPDISDRPDVQAFGRLAEVRDGAKPPSRNAFEQASKGLSEDATKEQVMAAYRSAGI